MRLQGLWELIFVIIQASTLLCNIKMEAERGPCGLATSALQKSILCSMGLHYFRGLGRIIPNMACILSVVASREHGNTGANGELYYLQVLQILPRIPVGSWRRVSYLGSTDSHCEGCEGCERLIVYDWFRG